MSPCEACHACCSSMRVDEISKPENVICENLCEHGCSIQETKPKSCKQFNCLWKQGLIDWDLRPDTCGLILYPNAKRGVIIEASKKFPKVRIYTAREVWPGAFEQQRAVLDTLSESRVIFLMKDEENRTIIGPNEVVLWLAQSIAKVRLSYGGGSRG